MHKRLHSVCNLFRIFLYGHKGLLSFIYAETNEGQCVVEQLDTCTGVVEGERSCLLDIYVTLYMFCRD